MRDKFLLFSTTSLFLTLFHFSCIKKVGKNQLTPVSTSDTTKVSECDTISYQKHIKAIVIQNCASNPQCHTSGISSGGINLDTYDELKTQANSGKIKNTIFNANPVAMPPNGYDQLTDAQKKLINCWLNNDLKN